jgi:hypothetical protein
MPCEGRGKREKEEGWGGGGEKKRGKGGRRKTAKMERGEGRMRRNGEETCKNILDSCVLV